MPITIKNIKCIVSGVPIKELGQGEMPVISVNQRTLRDSIIDGIQHAKANDSSILVSHVETISYINPLAFFKNGQSLFTGKRFFWSNPSGMTLVGAGIARTFEGHGKKRAQMVKREWRQLLERAIGKTNEKATGPVIIGGFAFDPMNNKTSHWVDFPEVGFYVPEVLLTLKGEKAFLSLNINVNPESHPSQLFDHYQALVEKLFLEDDSETYRLSTVIRDIHDIDVDKWLHAVETATRRIAEGELNKVVLSREVLVTSEDDFNTAAILEKLYQSSNNNYTFAFERGESCFVGTTPERLIERNEDWLLTGALAGTIGRGETEEEDLKLGLDLLHSSKNRQEHDYVVQMVLQAMEQFTEKVDLSKTPELLKVKDVQHLYTPISGKAKNGATLLDIVEQLHPTPALGGQPREKALTLIRSLETYNRGWYAAPIGWMDAGGQGEFAVAIRSGLLRKNKAVLFAGCGVVEASNPLEELEETHLKLRPMLSALEGNEEK